MQRENRCYYLMNHDSTDFTIAEIEEVVEYLGRDAHQDFKNDGVKCGCILMKDIAVIDNIEIDAKISNM